MRRSPKTQDEARAIARTARGALAEAGRPDLVDLVADEPVLEDGEWFGVAYLMLASEDDARLIHKAIRVAGAASAVCAACWIHDRALDCEHA